MMLLRRLYLEESDRGLLRRFARHHDGEAFSILMDRYADMVYTTCRRTLRDEAEAADAAQETFFELAKKADQITGSAGSWLHKVATRRAVDLIRQNASRRRREETYAQDAECRANSWSEVEPVVDEAMEDLPEELRELLVLHFLRGRSTVQIAAAQGVSQPTISRRMAEALEGLRTILRGRGIQVGLVPLQTVLLHSNHLAPEALRMSLGKIALVKAVGANTGWWTGATAPATAVGVKTIVAAAAIVAVVATVSVARHHPPEARAANTPPAAVSQPATNAVVAAQAPPRVDPAPIVQTSLPAPQPLPPQLMAANPRPRSMPARVPLPKPATKQPPLAPAPAMPTNGNGTIGTGELARAQSLADQRAAAAQYGRKNQADVPPRVVIYTPQAPAQETQPYASQGLNRTVTLGPRPVAPAYVPVRTTVTGPSPTTPNQPRRVGAL